MHTYPLAEVEPMRFAHEELDARFNSLVGGLPQENIMQAKMRQFRAHPVGSEAYAAGLAGTFR
jgi:hypothetical protein